VGTYFPSASDVWEVRRAGHEARLALPAHIRRLPRHRCGVAHRDVGTLLR